MREEVLKRPIDSLEGGIPQTMPEPNAPVTPRQKEAVLRALSGLDAVKREAQPEVAREIVSRHLDRHTQSQPLPTFITHFLNTHWRSYMTQLYIAEGEDSKAWNNSLEGTENLTWSLQPKCDDASRQRLYVLLPELFQWLHAVLRSQRVATSDEDAFFAELARFQVAALHSDSNAVSEPTPATAMEPAATDPPATEDLTASDTLAVRSSDGAAGNADRVESADQTQTGVVVKVAEKGNDSGPLRGLVIGKSVEFQSSRATKRILRLEWISRGGGVYLFRDQRRGDALCLTADRCIECLRERSFSLLN